VRKLSKVLLKVQGVTKRFDDVIANDNVSFEIRAGEVHSLLGENGAGKTTLMNILYGLYTPDAGQIEIKGEEVAIDSPATAIVYGVGMVQQHFALVPSFNVAENVLLGTKDWFRRKESRVLQRVEEIARRLDLRIDIESPVWQLAVGQQQLVEILKLLYRDVDVIILDEPTSALSPSETDRLLQIMKSMKSQEKGVVFVTHKLGEVKRVADRVTVLRRGRVVLSDAVSRYDIHELAEAMVGGYEPEKRLVDESWVSQKEVLKVVNLDVPSDMGGIKVQDLNLCIRAGEVVGLAGVEGNGQKELVEALMGLRPFLKGKIVLSDREFERVTPKLLRGMGVAYIPEDRFNVGLVKDMSVMENMVLNVYKKPPLCKKLFFNRRVALENARRLVKEYDIKLASLQQPVKLLSGGNAQKVIVAREFQTLPRLLIAVNPTQGLDVRSAKQVHDLIAKQARNGTAILLVSTDLQEIQILSHRVHVVYNGKLSFPLKPDEHERISKLMVGIGWGA